VKIAVRRAIPVTALLLLTAPALAQEPGRPGETARNTDISIRYNQNDIKPGERARFEVINTSDNIDYLTKTYVLTRANAANIFPLVNEAVLRENGRVDTVAAGGRAVINPETRQAEITDADLTYMVVTAPDWMFPGIDQTIETLDQPGLSAWDNGTLDAYFTLEHRRPSEVAEFLQDYATAGAILIPDDATDRLYVRDAPENFRAMVQAVGLYDTPAQAVMIEAEIVEIIRDDSQNLGLWWDAWKLTLPTDIQSELTLFHDRGRDADIDARVTESGLTGVISGTTPAYTRTDQVTASFLFDNISPQAAAQFVNYLVNAGHARILTSPRITVLQNETGVISSNTDFQILALPQQGEGARVLTDVAAAEGVHLQVRPFIGSNTIRLDIQAQVRSVVGLSETQLPITTTREVQSQAVLRDGERLTLAGLNREQMVKESAGLPGLRRIPGLRYLFSRETEVRRTSDIVIFLTPRIVQPGGEYSGRQGDDVVRAQALEDLAPLHEE
jgi:type II secretory pathway component GspD/PulD (secretin)